MKEQVKDVFEQIRMPEDCEKKILRAMAEEKRSKRGTFLPRLTAVAAVLALILIISPHARAAVNGWVLKYLFPESGMALYEETDANGNTVGIMGVDTEAKAFAEFREGRLYYTHNGEERDITDQITEQQPFYDSFVDEYGLTHYRAVGYSGSLENFGIYEFIREEVEGQGAREGWKGGSGRNFLDPKTETRYPWVDLVWEELGVPWSMPE